MKKVSLLILVLLTTFFILIRCNKTTSPEKKEPASEQLLSLKGMNPKKLKMMQSWLASHPNHRNASIEAATNPITICSGQTFSGSADALQSWSDPALWDIYTFSGNAGDVVTISVKRTGGCNMDPMFSLFLGTTTDYTGVSTDNGGPNMTYLLYDDDDVPPTCSGSCNPWLDPLLSNYTLPSTGTYTLAVYDNGGCGDVSTATYDLTISGIKSCTANNIIIGSCDTGVPDAQLSNGHFMNQEINTCASVAQTHAAFVTCVIGLTNSWKKAGLITTLQKTKIIACAASSNIGKK